MDFIFPLICILGAIFYMNEITMRFKGHHADKIRMAYKSEGDGLQTDDIFQKGYTYQIFICNYPVSKTYLAKRLSLLYPRVMEISDNEEGKNPSMRDG